jgi:hypothetical protein
MHRQSANDDHACATVVWLPSPKWGQAGVKPAAAPRLLDLGPHGVAIGFAYGNRGFDSKLTTY